MLLRSMQVNCKLIYQAFPPKKDVKGLKKLKVSDQVKSDIDDAQLPHPQDHIQ